MPVFTTPAQANAAVLAMLASGKLPAMVPATGTTPAVQYSPQLALTPNQLVAMAQGQPLPSGSKLGKAVRGVLRAFGHRAQGNWQALTAAQWQQAYKLAPTVQAGSTATAAQQAKAQQAITRTLTKAAGRQGFTHAPAKATAAAYSAQRRAAQQGGQQAAQQAAQQAPAQAPQA